MSWQRDLFGSAQKRQLVMTIFENVFHSGVAAAAQLASPVAGVLQTVVAVFSAQLHQPHAITFDLINE